MNKQAVVREMSGPEKSVRSLKVNRQDFSKQMKESEFESFS